MNIVYTIECHFNDKKICHKELTKDDINSIESTGAQFLIDVYEKYLNINIENYGLDRFARYDGLGFGIRLTEVDFVNLRENRIKNILE